MMREIMLRPRVNRQAGRTRVWAGVGWFHWIVVGSVGVFALVGCSGSDDDQTSGSLPDQTSVTSSSIPFCDPIDQSLPRYRDVSSELAARISEAIWEIEERYASSPTFALAGSRRVADGVKEIVVVFTDEDPGRDAEVEALIARAVGADFAEFVEARFERTRFSAAEIEVARNLLRARSDTYPEMPLSGGVGPQLRVDGSIQDLYRIALLDLTAAATFAERYDIPPPYDIYCIEPEEQPRDEPAG